MDLVLFEGLTHVDSLPEVPVPQELPLVVLPQALDHDRMDRRQRPVYVGVINLGDEQVVCRRRLRRLRIREG